MKCSYCEKESIIFVRRTGKHYCEDHFIQFFLRRVRKYLDKHRIRNKRIMVAVSGGKDSMVMLHALWQLSEKYNLKITPFYLDLGIKEYSKPCGKRVKEISETLSLELIEVNLLDFAGFTIDDIAKIERKPCRVCGIVKRYIMNKIAFENNFDFVATGHTMIDEAAFVIHNLYSGNIDQFFRTYEITPTEKEKKLVGRIKPLYYLMESETLTYALINRIPYCDLECPYAEGHPIQKQKEILLEGEYKFPGFIYNVLRSLNKIKKKVPLESGVQLKFCKVCGYPTTGDVCNFCKVKMKYSKR